MGSKKKRKREIKKLLKKGHLKLQVESQTLKFVLPAVPNVTERGQPGANSCSAGEFVPGWCTDTGGHP